MGRLFHPLLFLLARCTKNQLIRQIEFLKTENQILKSRIPTKFIIVKPAERARLMKLAEGIGPALQQLITVVRYDTYLGWLRNATTGRVPKKRGRPRTAEVLREIVVKIGTETGWGYTRVMGEMKKLGIKPPSRSTVQRILKVHKLEPDPKGNGTWNQFLQMHADTLWQCDFFSKEMWTPRGVRRFFALAFLHVGSRRAFVTPCTQHPIGAWMQQQGEAFVQHVRQEQLPVAIVMRDRDRNYKRKTFDAVLNAAGIQVRKTMYRSPNLQAYVERFIQSVKQECLDHFILCGEDHVDYLVREYVDYYDTERPHQAKGNLPLVGEWPALGEVPGAEGIVCRERLGGLLKHYERRAA
jgi:putative transposase